MILLTLKIYRTLSSLATVEAQEKLGAGLLSYADFKTVIHGDFHRGNVFIDRDKVTLIDNATIGDSIITSKSPINDIYRFYGFTYIDGLWGLNPKQFQQVDNSFMNFIEGYVSAFPLSIQNSITEFLHTTFAKIHEEIKQQFEDYLTNKINDIPPITTNDQNLKWFLNFIFGNLKHYVAKGGEKSQMAEKLFQIPAGKSAILI